MNPDLKPAVQPAQQRPCSRAACTTGSEIGCAARRYGILVGQLFFQNVRFFLSETHSKKYLNEIMSFQYAQLEGQVAIHCRRQQSLAWVPEERHLAAASAACCCAGARSGPPQPASGVHDPANFLGVQSFLIFGFERRKLRMIHCTVRKFSFRKVILKGCPLTVQFRTP